MRTSKRRSYVEIDSWRMYPRFVPVQTRLTTGREPAEEEEKGGQSPFVLSTLRAVPANGDCPPFSGRPPGITQLHLATYFLFAMPPFQPEKPPVDNWQTSPWTPRSPGLGGLSAVVAGDDHLDRVA